MSALAGTALPSALLKWMSPVTKLPTGFDRSTLPTR